MELTGVVYVLRRSVWCPRQGQLSRLSWTSFLHREPPANQLGFLWGRSCCRAACDRDQPASAHGTQEEERPGHNRYAILSVLPHAFHIFVMSNPCFCLLGYVLGILMMAIIIVLGAGITFGYFYKRYWSTWHQINIKKDVIFQWSNRELLLSLWECSSLPAVQVECQYELNTHPVWATC